jgi:hypothetical protein
LALRDLRYDVQHYGTERDHQALSAYVKSYLADTFKTASRGPIEVSSRQMGPESIVIRVRGLTEVDKIRILSDLQWPFRVDFSTGTRDPDLILNTADVARSDWNKPHEFITEAGIGFNPTPPEMNGQLARTLWKAMRGMGRVQTTPSGRVELRNVQLSLLSEREQIELRAGFGLDEAWGYTFAATVDLVRANSDPAAAKSGLYHTTAAKMLVLVIRAALSGEFGWRATLTLDRGATRESLEAALQDLEARVELIESRLRALAPE